MIHHHFKNKQGLLDAVLEQYSIQVFLVPMKLMQSEVRSKDELQSRLRMIFESTLEACLKYRDVVVLTWREQMTPHALVEYLNCFKEFLESARSKGIVRESIDPDMITGFMFDRIMNQVQLAPWLKTHFSIDIGQRRIVPPEVV